MTDGLKTERANAVPVPKLRLTARGLLLGERIDTAGLERSDVISTTPLAFRIGAQGYAVLFRFGVAVLVGCRPSRKMTSCADLPPASSDRSRASRTKPR